MSATLPAALHCLSYWLQGGEPHLIVEHIEKCDKVGHHSSSSFMSPSVFSPCEGHPQSWSRTVGVGQSVLKLICLKKMHILQYPSFNNDKRDMLTSICLFVLFLVSHNRVDNACGIIYHDSPPPA